MKQYVYVVLHSWEDGAWPAGVFADEAMATEYMRRRNVPRDEFDNPNGYSVLAMEILRELPE